MNKIKSIYKKNEEVTRLLVIMAAVSYTHLDVYKRQQMK